MEQMSFNDFFEQLDSLDGNPGNTKLIHDPRLDESLDAHGDITEYINSDSDLDELLSFFEVPKLNESTNVMESNYPVTELIMDSSELKVGYSVEVVEELHTESTETISSSNICVDEKIELLSEVTLVKDIEDTTNVLDEEESSNQNHNLFVVTQIEDNKYEIKYNENLELPESSFVFDDALVEDEDPLNEGPLAQVTIDVVDLQSPKVVSLDYAKKQKSKNKKNSKYKGYNSSKENLSQTPMTRFEDNLNALNKLKELELSGKDLTKSDAEVLAKYSGWGALGDFFKESHPRNAELQELLGDSYNSAMYSVTSAYYTPVNVIKFMYNVLKRFGFKRGKVLECSVGNGRFFSFMNKSIYEKSKLYGVELDETSSKIASYLHPKAKIINSGFEKTEFGEGEFDVCISNIPFGDLSVFDNQDKDLNKYHFKIHDYFFAKALKKVRNGGVIAFVTSTGFMDKKNSVARELLSKESELLGVLRLPNSTFIGTNVVADIVFLRKTSEPNCANWTNCRDIEYVDGEFEIVNKDKFNPDAFSINEYIYSRKGLIAGKLGVTSTQFGEALTVNGDSLTSEEFDNCLKYFPSNVYIPRDDESYLYEDEDVINRDTLSTLDACLHHPWIKDLRDDEYVYLDDKLYKSQNNTLFKESLPVNRYNLIKRYALVKGAVMDIRTNPDVSDSELAIMQARLNKYYEDFVSHHGNVADPKHRKILGSDHVGYPLFIALENVTEVYDEKTDSIIPIYKKSDIFTQRVVGKSFKVEDPKTLQEAIVLSFYLTRKLDLHLMSERLGRDLESVIADCINEGLIYYDFQQGKYEESSEFLSGYVKDKLSYTQDLLNRVNDGNNITTVPVENESFLSNSQSAKMYIPHLERNIAALKENQPEFVDDVDFEFSSTWIPISVKEEFIFKSLEIDNQDGWVKLLYDERLGYEFKCPYSINPVLMNSEWGTSRVKATRVLEHALNDTVPEVTDTIMGKSCVNIEESQMAMTMVKKWTTSFKEHVLSNPDLHLELVQLYNDEFVRIKEKEQRNFIIDAQTNPSIKPREHQLKAASRICTSSNSTLLYHEVGTGKTFTMQIASHMLYKMRMQAEGRPNKSMFVVPNSLCLSGQFAREYLTIYPDANILALTPEDFEKKNRRKILSKIATNNWEAVIIPHSVLNMIPMKEETLTRLYDEDIRDMERALYSFEKDGNSLSVYKMQQMISKRKAKMEELLAIHKDEFSIYWEDLGVDTLFVDEAHNFKSLYFVTRKDRIAGINTNASKQASNLYNIVRYQREKEPSSIVFATATPISNTVGELFNFSRYLNPEGLKRHGVYEFDAWSSTFGSIVNEVEADVTGQNFKVKPRFAKFFNTPELMSMVKEFADVVFTENVAEIKVPELISGKPIDVEIEPTDLMLDYIDQLVDRVGKFENSSGLEKRKDNMLKICGDGRKLALAPKLVGIDEASPKVRAVVDKVYKVYSENPDCTQLIFSDLGTPDSSGGYSVYQEIKDALIDMGILESEIAFIHDCGSSPAKREALIKKFNDGIVKVLMGSTSKMGEGVNLQKRVKALHHVDAPWRPSDVKQREGRILRHGNINEEVYIFRYLVKNSFDVFSWQTLERKAKFIAQIASGSKDVRSIDDIGSEALSYAAAKATASGNPLIMEHCSISTRVKELEILESGFARQQVRNKTRIKDLTASIKNYEKQLEILEEDLEVIQAYDSSYVTFSAFGVEYVDKERILELLKALPRVGVIGNAFGLPVKFDDITGTIVIGYSTILKLDFASLPANVYKRLETIPVKSQEAFMHYSNLVKRYKEELKSLSEYIKKPFSYKQELEEARSRKLEIEGILQADQKKLNPNSSDALSDENDKPIVDFSELSDPIVEFEVI